MILDLNEFRAVKRREEHDAQRRESTSVERAGEGERCPFAARYSYRQRCDKAAAFFVSVPSEKPGYRSGYHACSDHIAEAVDLLLVEETDPDAVHYGEHSCVTRKALCPSKLGRNGPNDRFADPGQPYESAKYCESCEIYAFAKSGGRRPRNVWPTQRAVAEARRDLGLKPIWVNMRTFMSRYASLPARR